MPADGSTRSLVDGRSLATSTTIRAGRLLFNSGIYTGSNVVSSPANCASCSPGLGSVFTDPGTGYAFYFNQPARSQFSVPTPGTIEGSAGRNTFQTPGWFNMNLSFSKRVAINDRVKLELRGDTTDLTNSPEWDVPTTSLQSATFGRLYTPLTGHSRKTQLGVKVSF
jgi:hypothetical protein